MSKAFNITKTVVGTAAEFGADCIVQQAVRPIINSIPSLPVRVCAEIGNVCGTAIIGMKVHEYSDQVFDAFANMYHAIDEERKLKKEEKARIKETKIQKKQK